MLFGNFVCLLYLMVLVDSHTISKSINEQKRTDAIYDKLNDYEYTTRRLFHHEKFLHNHRRDKIEDSSKLLSGQANTKEIFEHVQKTTTTDPPTLHLRPVHKSTKRRIGRFWRKFKIKARNEDLDRENRLRQYLNRLPITHTVTILEDYPKMTTKTNKEYVLLKKKRDAFMINDIKTTGIPQFLNNEITYLTENELNITPNENLTTDSIPSYRPYKSDADDIQRILSNIVTKAAQLKETYGLNSDSIKNTSPELSFYEKYFRNNKESQSTSEEIELLGTAQIEALLDSIKEKAMSMITEQSPAVTDVITNTVTEATFEADPILNRIGIENPEFSLSTFFSIKNFGHNKRYAKFSECVKDDTTKPYTKTYDVAARSIKDEAISFAQNVEEKLQKELKTIYKKVKNKVSSDLKKEIHEAKSTIKQKINSTLKKATSNKCHMTNKNSLVTKPNNSNSSKHSTTKNPRQNRRNKVSIKDDTNTKNAYTETTVDDYAMLTLFEQMLAKTHENNVQKMLSTPDNLIRDNRKESLHNSKRNVVALVDQATNNVNNNYDDNGDQSPEVYDYSIPISAPDIKQTVPGSNDIEDGKVTSADDEGSKENGEEENELKKETNSQGVRYESNKLREGNDKIKPANEEYPTGFSETTQSTDQRSFEDISYENLINQMSYNEFVNGYKHYLKFQKDQANQNFSNLVKYQAHRHHSVDDIGKYILNKIPQCPQLPSRNKRFFDDYDIDDQDVATKSDDSWFKKHFYMFLDNGPPKKYHTSQTVSLKSPIGYKNRGITETDTNLSTPSGNLKHLESSADMEINLEELTKTLLNENSSTDVLLIPDHLENYTTHASQNGKLMEIVPELKEFGPHLISKLFGKARRTLKPQNEIFASEAEQSSAKLQNANNNEETQSDFLWKNYLDRYRRNAKQVSNITKPKEKQSTVKTSKTSDKKHANVDVNIVPQTASTKAKKLSSNASFIKNLLNLMHFGKHRDRTSKRVRRDERVQRFSPLKKFRDLFRSKPEDKLFKTNLNIADYEIMKSHLDTFKPIRYNKILSVEEMKEQIPNITDEMEMTLKINDIETKKDKCNITTKKEAVEGQLPNLRENLEFTNTFRTYTKKYNKPKTTVRYRTTFTNNDDIFKINVKTLATVGYHADNILASTTHRTIDDIRDEVDDIGLKISSEDYNNDLLVNIPKTTQNYLELNTKNSQLHNYQTSPRSTKSLSAYKNLRMDHMFQDNNFNGNTIGINYARNTKLDDKTNEYTQQNEITKMTQRAKSNINRLMDDSTRRKQVHYNDLYNDLVMWHKDILQSDQVPTPWQDILNVIQPHNEYTPPNIEDIRKELTEVTGTLKDYKLMEPPIRSWAKEPKTVVVDSDKRDEDKVGKRSKNVLIQEEIFRIDKKMKKSSRDLEKGLDNFKTPSYPSMNQEKNIGLFKEDKRRDDQSLILFDTTLLSYDDDINYIMNKLTPRKLSKNSLKILDQKQKTASAQAVAKINEQPLQYFSTPLPMRKFDFERFLKENNLDVASVTSPLVALPSVPTINPTNQKANPPVAIKNNKKTDFNKQKSHSVYNKKVTKTVTVDDIDTSPDEFHYLDELHNELYDNYYDDKVRYKRYDETSNYSYAFTSESNSIGNTDSKLNKIEAHSTTDANFDVDELRDSNNHPQNDIQLTIINLDDVDKKLDENSKTTLTNFRGGVDFRNPDKYTITTPKSYTTEPVSAISRTTAAIDFEKLGHHTRDEEFFNKIHNNLLYNRVHTKKSTADTFVSQIDEHLGKVLPLPADILKQMPSKGDSEPKRVRISGQSYKYDIIYHRPEKKDHIPSSAPSFETFTERDIIFTKNIKRPSLNIFSAGVNAELTTEQIDKRRYLRDENKVMLTLKSDDEIKDNGLSNANNNVKPVIEDKTSESSTSLNPQSEVIVATSAKIADVRNIMAKPNNSPPKDNLVYMEPGLYDDQILFEYNIVKSPKGKQDLKNVTNNSSTKNITLNKRDLSNQNIYTAKDVAALEVIVDLLKNSVNTEESGDLNTKTHSYAGKRVTNSQLVNRKAETVPNSIQVHIAIPYENNDKKRALKPVRVRKVFSAKLSSPVDLEYQIHSLEVTPTSDITTSKDGLSPGIYLVVDNSQIPKAIALKPIKSDLACFNRREAETKIVTEKTVTKNPTTDLVKVTLSKDLLSAINKHLSLYSNVTGSNKISENIENINVKDNRPKRGINWDRVKKYFEHDRVCNCKCKANKTMCRACAASDAVMNELIFEFDNLAKYMNEHCTEIQTYFRMNPSGGKKLRDSVHKIDKSLRDYFKRVKGKCQGRTCKTFATYIDKREFGKQNKIEKNVAWNFINALETAATDTENAAKIATCLNTRLIQKRDQLIDSVNDCICKRNHNKRATTQTEQEVVKNVYSLDNVNVNIICKSDSTTPCENREQNDLNLDTVSQSNWNCDNNVKISEKHGKFKKLFSCFRKSKLDKNSAKKSKAAKNKRETKQKEIESPLIADSGGSFWFDYINRKSTEPKIESNIEPDVKISVIQTQNITNSTISNKNDDKSVNENLEMFSTIANDGINISKEGFMNDHNTSDSVVSNISDFFKILDNFKITKKGTKRTTDVMKLKHKNSTATTVKSKKTTKLQNKTIAHIKKAREKNKKTKPKIKSQNKGKDIYVINPIYETKSMNLSTRKISEGTEKKSSDLDKLEMVTFSVYGNNFDKDSSQPDEAYFHNISDTANKELNTKTTNRHVTGLESSGTLSNEFNKHVISQGTTESNPTIIILNDYSKNPEKYKNLLLSIIEHESNKLNDEWLRYAFASNVVDEGVTEEMKSPLNALKHFKRKGRKTTKQNIEQVTHATDENFKTLDVPKLSSKASESEDGLLKKIVNKLNKKIRGEKKGMVVTEIRKNEIKVPVGKKKIMKEEHGKEVCDLIRAPRHLCDLKATSKHVLGLYKRLKRMDFEIYVNNITCYKYRKVPKCIFINNNNSKTLNGLKRWNYRRDKRFTRRRLLATDIISNNKVDFENNVENVGKQFGIEDIEDFETFYKGNDHIYRYDKRKRRNAVINDIARDIGNLPPVPSHLKEIDVIAGDTVMLNCFGGNKPMAGPHQYTWRAERKDMLDQDNVVIDATTVTIRDVQANNGGYYKCSENTGYQENFKVSVFALPTFTVIHSAIYSMDSSCTHQDLVTLELIGTKLSDVACSGACAGLARETFCLTDNNNCKDYIGVTVTLASNPEPRVECSVQCRRNIRTALASLLMGNAVSLGSVRVMLVENGVNKLLTPAVIQAEGLNTGVLSRKGERHTNAVNPSISVGTKLVPSCPAGYNLLEDLKLCAACPVNAYAREGDNKCFACPRGSSSEPGAVRCRGVDQRPRRYDWWWYPPCGYCVAFGVIVFCCGVCVALAFVVHVTSRGCCPRGDEKLAAKRIRKETTPRTRKQPQSPSRVILSKFFKASLTSSWATDSQERKFEQWKGKNVAPPLPPVDFDIFDT